MGGHLRAGAPVDDERLGRAETARDAGAEVRFGAGRGHIDAAVDQGVDERANDFGAVENFSAPAADVSSEPIELDDLAVEQHHGDLGPRFLMDGWAAAAGPRSEAQCFRFHAFPRHRCRCHPHRNYTNRLLVAQTQLLANG